MTADPTMIELARVQHERDAYRAMLCDLLASAHPHPVEHPTMTAQWARARELLNNGPKSQLRCSCTHEAGDSRCEVHPTCNNCGGPKSSLADRCEPCWARGRSET